jgi:acyl transferase domain-containing protein
MNELSSSRRLLIALDEAVARLERVEREKTDPIAIIGMSCRLPGHVHDLASYWRIVIDGRDAIGEVPPTRWSNDVWFDPDPDAPAKIVTRYGGFLDNVEEFDYRFFGLSPREALSLDPQHRLALELAWEALENAGQPREQFAGTSTGIFLGITTNDYARITNQRRPLADLDGYFSTGNALNAAAGRLSYFLGLHGPSMAVDTACSSSLVAVHLACQSLRAGECEMALAGGVNIILAPEVSVALSRGRMLSPDGHCKTFDAAADGYGRSEGCGLIVLKRQSDAVAARDPIVAVIRGSAVNQDGASGGFTVPSGSAQQQLIRRALASARLKPSQIDYVEAHGTGTALGDPIEVNALGEVFAEGRSFTHPLFVGSVKANIGHLESAAGAAGLIKVALALAHETIPPHRPIRQLNPHVSWETLPITIPDAPVVWPGGAEPRRAGVSSFGASGTNAHVVLEEAPVPDLKGTEHDRPAHVLTLGARTPQALRDLAARYCALLTDGAAPAFADVCYSANTGRTQFGHRLAVLATHASQAAQALDAWLAARPSADIVAGQGASVAPVRLAVHLTSCSAPPDFARDLYAHHAAFREFIDRCADIAASIGAGDLRAALFADGSQPVQSDIDLRLAAFAGQVGVMELLERWGIRATVVSGDACAEEAAAYIAGVEPLRAALRKLAGVAGAPELPTATEESTRMPIALRPGFADTAVASPAEQPCDVVLVIGSERMTPEGSEGSIDTATLNLSSPGDGAASARWRPLLQVVAELYARGVQVDWRAFDAEYGRHRVPLPNYPWQRERCWVEASSSTTAGNDTGTTETPMLALLSRGDTASLASLLAGRTEFLPQERDLLPRLLDLLVQQHQAERAGNAAVDSYRSWLYEVEWRAAAGAAGRERALRAPRLVVAEVEAQGALAAGGRLAAYDAGLRALEQFSAAAARQALQALGWPGRVGERVQVERLREQLGVVARYERLLARLLEMLEETGWLRRVSAREWEVVRSWAESPGEALGDAGGVSAEVVAEWTLLARCARALPAVLRGEREAVAVVFPEGEVATAARLYREAPGAQLMNGLVAEVVRGVVRDWPADRQLRVLEIGAGTGGTTAAVREALPGERTEYTFTDVSPRFLDAAVTQFGPWGALRTAVLDIEQPPGAQGFGGGQYDVIVAANVLHATRELGVTLGHVRELLAPGGVLVLLEGTAKVRFVDLIFGLLDGWWRFADTAVRPTHPLLSAAAWTTMLEASGFVTAAALTAPDGSAGEVLARQAVIVAQATAEAPTAPGRWLILADEGGVGAALAAALEARGGTCRMVYAAAAAAADGRERVDPGRPEALAALLATAGPLRGVVHLWSLDSPPAAALTAATLRASCAHSCGSALHLVQALIAHPAGDTPPRLCLVTRDAVSTEHGSAVRGLAQSPLWGLGRTLSLEHPNLRTLLVDVDDTPTFETADRLLDELLANTEDDRVAVRSPTRYVARLKRHTPATSVVPPRLRFRDDATYLITGGLGGLGLLVTQWMIANGARHVVLMGRSSPSAAAQDTLRTISRLGGEVDVLCADVSDEAALNAALQQMTRTHPLLRGIIHAAGVLDDAVLTQQSWARFGRVLDAKAAGAWNLVAATRDLSLDFFVLFSSVASLIGSPSQANHAAANAFLDACAHYLQGRGVRAISVNWGAWAETGAAASRHVEERITALGLGTIAPQQGLQALGYILMNSMPQIGVLPIDWIRFMEDHQSVPFLSDFTRWRETPRARPESDILREIDAAPDKKRRAMLEAHVERLTRTVLRLAPRATLDPQQGFFELGMDSLTSMELKNKLQKSLQINLPNTLTFDHPTPQALVAYLMHTLFSSSASAGDVSESSLVSETAGLDELSSEELGTLIDAAILDAQRREIRQ